jgi:carbon storage regulator
MLVLTRKINESIIIEENIKIKILEVKGEKVKLGIIAPKNLTILRDELYQEVSNQNKQATDISEQSLKELSKSI